MMVVAIFRAACFCVVFPDGREVAEKVLSVSTPTPFVMNGVLAHSVK
jgi:hypothetical protein